MSDQKRGKSQKEESIPLLISFCRLAATGANTLPRPSNHSVATATGSNRSSADSDLLLCHVRLWRTSRELTDSRKRTRSASPRQGGRSNGAYLVRTYQNKIYFDSPVSVGIRPTPATHYPAGVQTMRARICSASSCAMFARVVVCDFGEWQNYRFSPLCPVPHALAAHGSRD